MGMGSKEAELLARKARIEKDLADAKLALEKLQAQLEAAGVSPAELADYEAGHRARIAKESLAHIGQTKRNKLTALAGNAAYISSTTGTNNNCLLDSLVTHNKAAFTHGKTSSKVLDNARKQLYGWYDILFADNFPANIKDDITTLFNKEFGANPACTNVNQTVAALTRLNQALRVAVTQQEVGIDGSASNAVLRAHLHDAAEGRMLHAADILLASALLRREVIVVRRGDGAIEEFNPERRLSAPFNVAGGAPAYVQHNGGVHFQGINAAGVARYQEIVSEEAAQINAQNAELKKDDILLANKQAELSKGKDPAVAGNLVNYVAALRKVVRFEKDLAVHMGTAPKASVPTPSAPPSSASSSSSSSASASTATSAAPAKPYTPPTAGLAADQLLALNAAREKLVKSLKAATAGGAKINSNFLENLEGHHYNRNRYINEKDLLKAGKKVDGRKHKAELFNTVLYNGVAAVSPNPYPALYATNVDAVVGDTNTSLFRALGMKDTEVVLFQNRIASAQAKLNDAPAVGLVLAALCPAVQQKAAEIARIEALRPQLEEYTVALNKRAAITAGELALRKEAADHAAALGKTSLTTAEFEVYRPRVAMILADRRKNEDDILRLEGLIPIADRAQSLDDLDKQKAQLENELNLAKQDYQIIENAFNQFKAKMELYAAQQADGKGDVLNPYDVQWAAILRQQTIVVIQRDGSTKEFSHDIFADIDAASLSDPSLLDRARERFFDDLGVDRDPLATDKKDRVIYVLDNQSAAAAHAYQAFTADGQKACRQATIEAEQELGKVEKEVKDSDKQIADSLNDLNPPIDPALKNEAEAYSVLLGRAHDAIREGKPLADAIGAPAPKQHAWEAKLDKLDAKDVVSITSAEDNQRDIHRQNIDVLLTLFLQGTSADRTAFDAQYAAAGAAVINLKANNVHPDHNYGIPFDKAPMFYAKGMAQPPFGALAGTKVDQRIVELLEKEINAYLELKKVSPDSALARDYKAVLFAIKMDFIKGNLSTTGLKDIPNSSLKEVIEDIHARVAAKAGHVANVIDHNAYDGKYGATNVDQIRKAIHACRVADAAAKGKPAPAAFDATKAPQAAHAVKQTSYMNAPKARIVFDIKGMTIDQVMAAFNDNVDARNEPLTVKNDKGEDRRIVALLENGRIKLSLQDAAGKTEPLTTGVWARAEANVKKVINEIAGENAALTNTEHASPRRRGP